MAGGAPQPGLITMIIQDPLASCPLMEVVDILRNDRLQMPHAFQFRQCMMSGIGGDLVQIPQERWAAQPFLPVCCGVCQEHLVPLICLSFRLGVLRPDSRGTAEIGDPGFRRDAGPGQRYGICAFLQIIGCLFYEIHHVLQLRGRPFAGFKPGARVGIPITFPKTFPPTRLSVFHHVLQGLDHLVRDALFDLLASCGDAHQEGHQGVPHPHFILLLGKTVHPVLSPRNSRRGTASGGRRRWRAHNCAPCGRRSEPRWRWPPCICP